MLHEILNALEETLFMVFSAGLLTWIVGLPLGTLLAITGPKKFLAKPLMHRTLELLIGATQSLPYIALMVVAIPLTKILVGSAEGCIAAIVPLTLASIPHFAQLCRKAINRVPAGLTETAQAIGASPFQIVTKILIPEAIPNIISGLTGTLIHLLSFSTIAGALGSGGLGGLILHKGYHSFQLEYVLTTVVILMVLVQLIQTCGNYIANGSIHHNSNA